MTTKQIVFASRNAGKIKEIKALLKPFNVDVLSAAELDLSDVQETGLSFEENAKIKALAAAQETGLPALGSIPNIFSGTLDSIYQRVLSLEHAVIHSPCS